MHDKIVVFLQVWHQDIYVVDCIQIFFYLCFLGAALHQKATPTIHFFHHREQVVFPSGSIETERFGLQSCYMTAGGSLSLIGSSSLRFPGPFLFAFESPLSEEGRKRYKTTAKTTQTMAIIANPLSPVPWPGPGSPSWKKQRINELIHIFKHLILKVDLYSQINGSYVYLGNPFNISFNFSFG